MATRARSNGEGSIFPYRNGFAAYVWVTKPDGKRGRKYVYGKTREEVHDKWLELHRKAKDGPVVTKALTLGNFIAYWLREIAAAPRDEDTDLRRRASLPEICTVALKERRTAQAAAREEAGAAWNRTDLVFTTRFGTPIEPRNFIRYWDRRCDLAGVRRITIRDARRTCASLLADLDVHPRVAMQILRHAQFSITMEIYTVVSSAATREALKKLGESLDH